VFGLKKKTQYEVGARDIYEHMIVQTALPAFYERYGVPDNFDGRFDLLVLHGFMIIQRLINEGASGQAFNQALFDEMFANIDQNLRQMGIGDMGIPKHMKRMMKAFNGRMNAYQASLDDGGDLSYDVLRRNLYGTLDEVPETGIQAMREYCERQIALLSDIDAQEILSGRFTFAQSK